MFPGSFYPRAWFPAAWFPPRVAVVVGPGPGPFEAITASVAVARGPLASRATAIARGAALASKAAPRGPDPGRSVARPYGS